MHASSSFTSDWHLSSKTNHYAWFKISKSVSVSANDFKYKCRPCQMSISKISAISAILASILVDIIELISYRVPQNPIRYHRYVSELTDVWNHATTYTPWDDLSVGEQWHHLTCDKSSPWPTRIWILYFRGLLMFCCMNVYVNILCKCTRGHKLTAMVLSNRWLMIFLTTRICCIR